MPGGLTGGEVRELASFLEGSRERLWSLVDLDLIGCDDVASALMGGTGSCDAMELRQTLLDMIDVVESCAGGE